MLNSAQKKIWLANFCESYIEQVSDEISQRLEKSQKVQKNNNQDNYLKDKL